MCSLSYVNECLSKFYHTVSGFDKIRKLINFYTYNTHTTDERGKKL